MMEMKEMILMYFVIFLPTLTHLTLNWYNSIVSRDPTLLNQIFYPLRKLSPLQFNVSVADKRSCTTCSF